MRGCIKLVRVKVAGEDVDVACKSPGSRFYAAPEGARPTTGMFALCEEHGIDAAVLKDNFAYKDFVEITADEVAVIDVMSS